MKRPATIGTLLGLGLTSGLLWTAPAGAVAARRHIAVTEAPPAEQDLPLPPIPPAVPPSDTPAPIPDFSMAEPPSLPSEGIVVKPTLNQALPDFPGADPVPGTTFRSDQAQRRNLIPSPGLRLVVPLR